MIVDTHIDISDFVSLSSCSSKHGGLAGSRFGWGLYEDPMLAANVTNVIDTLVLGLSIDVELRVLASMQAVLSKLD